MSCMSPIRRAGVGGERAEIAGTAAAGAAQVVYVAACSGSHSSVDTAVQEEASEGVRELALWNWAVVGLRC